MNLLLLDDCDFVEVCDFVGELKAIVLDDRVRHVRKVLRLEVGDELRVGRLEGLIGVGRIKVLDRGRLELTVRLEDEPPPRLEVDLVLALPRPKFLGRILQAASSFGVERITLLQTARVEKSYWQSSVLEAATIMRHLRQGLEQAVDTRLPACECRRNFGEFTESELPARLAARPGLIAHSEAPIAFPRRVDLPRTLIIGPEGGLLDSEIETLEAAGASLASLGRRVLKVEVAVAACLSRCLPG